MSAAPDPLPKKHANGAHASTPAIANDPHGFEAMYPLRSILGADGKASQDVGLDAPGLKKIIELMVWNRELDERLTKLQRQGRIGFHIGSVGEEALMIGRWDPLESTCRHASLSIL